MEVLISIFVLSIGLLGVASLIPIGKIALVETNKSDRTGACGRAGLREVKIRRMLDYTIWSPPVAGTTVALGSIAIDPLGYTSGSTGSLGNLSRYTFTGVTTPAAADAIFRWKDDLVFNYTRDKSIGPQLLPSGLTYEGNYSWFVTVTPATSEFDIPLSQKKLFNVSVVVCYKRVLGATGETSSGVTFPGVTGTPPIAYTGGSVTLGSAVKVKENDWVMLCCQRRGVSFSQWYRVISAGASSPTVAGVDSLTLLGPDWDTSAATTLVAIDSVSGVYSTTMQLDQ